jgi:hypothetical protein
MKFMANPNNPSSSASDQAGSGQAPAVGGAGQAGNVNYEALYKELETKLGTQGKELGDYRTFFDGIAPILDTLDKSPELVQAIVNGKLDNTIARAALEGKITVEDLKAVDKAHAEVKKELGPKAYKDASVEEVAKMVEDKVGVVKKEMQDSLRESEELHSFENKVNDFVERTPDFPEYAKEIENWLDSHDDITDIEVAYFAVKGQLSGKQAEAKAEEERAEYAKNLAANAGGGGHRSNFISANEGDVIDSLIAPRSNPNMF